MGSEYWSFALAHAVYIKNCLFHSSLGTTPFQAFTGRWPDLSKLCIFGSRVYARKPGNRPAKLDHLTSEGIFLTFIATDNNVYYIDDESRQVRIGQYVIFDKAHMTVPAGRAPLAAQALQHIGYHLHESWVQQETHDDNAPNAEKLQVNKIKPTAKLPTQGTPDSVRYDLYLDLPESIIPPGEIGLLPTGISARPPKGSYI